MTREEAKELLPIIKEFAEGKVLEYYNDDMGEWITITNPVFINPKKFRIKTDPKYRPFKTQEECWGEMLKHQPFGWLKNKISGHHRFIGELYSLPELFTGVMTVTPTHVSIPYSSVVFNAYTFADGEPFGIKEE